MLDNIKSVYFSKIIFSFLNEEVKLKIVKYNKTLQKSLNIGLVNYKVLSRRYIIFGENGKGREYNILDNSLIFEGEYKNGKRNGKGKEYYDYFAGKLKFEGEFLDGKRNGKGKEYSCFYYGTLISDCEYLNGQRNGKFKEYYYNGKLRAEGEYLNGKKWNIKFYAPSGDSVYELKEGKGQVKEYNDFCQLQFD